MVGDIMQGVNHFVLQRSLLLVAGAYRGRQPDHSFGSEPGRPEEDNVTHSHFQHCIVVPGSVLHQIEILREKVSFP